MGARTRGGFGVLAGPLVVPRRKTTLRGRDTLRSEEDEDDEREHDRARRIWGEIRRMSSVGSGGEVEEERKVSYMSVLGENRKEEADRRRKAISERALRNRRSLGADTLRSLVPTEVDGITSGQVARGSENETMSKRPTVSKMDSLDGRGKGKENVLWSWTGWWQ
jgi:hypothetical protein